MRGFPSLPLLGLSRLRRCWVRIIVACVPAGLVVAVVAVACSSDTSTGPGVCTGTCIAVKNQADRTLNEVYFRPCTEAPWGVNRLSGTVILPNDEREWPINAGCWDILLRAPAGADFCSNFENDIEIPDGERHVAVYGGCTTARVRVGVPDS